MKYFLCFKIPTSSETSPELIDLLEKMLVKDPHDRQNSLNERCYKGKGLRQMFPLTLHPKELIEIIFEGRYAALPDWLINYVIHGFMETILWSCFEPIQKNTKGMHIISQLHLLFRCLLVPNYNIFSLIISDDRIKLQDIK